MVLTDSQKKRMDRLRMLVTVRVDEYTNNSENPVPDIPMGDIDQELHDASKMALRRVTRQHSFLSAKKQTGIVPITDTGNNSTTIPLADDFMRFVSLKLKGWKRAASDYVLDDSPIYQQQQYEHRRGSAEKPVVAMIPFLETHKRNYADNRISYSNADAKQTATWLIGMTQWVYTTALIPIKVDGYTLNVGGFNTSGAWSGGQATQLIAQMLNGEFVDGAAGYDQLPDGYVAENDGGSLFIKRTQPGYNPLTVKLPTEFTSQVQVTSNTQTTPGFSAAPIPGDKLQVSGTTVAEVLQVFPELNEATIKLDQQYLELNQTLTPESGKYDASVVALTSKTFDGVSESNKALQAFPSGEVDSLYYVGYPKAYEMPADFEEIITWAAASNVLSTVKQFDSSKLAMQNSEKYIAIMNGGQDGEKEP